MLIAITGATGFLGSHLCRALIQQGHTVHALCRPNSPKVRNLDGLPVERVLGDVTEPTSLQPSVRGCDWVVHAAANISYWDRERAYQFRVNVEGSRNLARAARCAGVKRMIHVSSVAAVGVPADASHPADERFAFNLNGSALYYHLSKHQAEQAVLTEVSRGLDAVTINPASVFGPYRRTYRGGEMIAKVRRTPVVPYFTGGICAVHVDDVVQGILGALERGRPGQRYILGGENITYRAIVERAAKVMGLRRAFVPIPPVATALAARILAPVARMRNAQPRFTYATQYFASRYQFYDSTRARAELGFAPRGIDAIVRDSVQWDRQA